jgi:GAF domain-containing protein/CHASE3 domain sensor protein
MAPADGPVAAPGARVRGAHRRLLAVFGFLIVILLVVVTAGIVVSRDINDSARRAYVEDAIPLKARVQDLVTGIVTQQSAVRGYLVTGEPIHAAVYRGARARALADLEYIRDHLEGHPILADLLRRAEPRIAALQAYYRTQIDRVRSGPSGVEAARDAVGRGTDLFAAFRPLADAMVRDTDAFVSDARRSQDDRTRNLTFLLLVFGLVGLALAVGLAVVVPRRAARLLGQLEDERVAADAAEERTRRLQEVTAALGRASGIDDITRTILGEAGGTAGSIALLSRDGRTFETVGMIGYRPDIVEGFPSYPADAALPIPDAVREGTPLFVRSVAEVAGRWPAVVPYQREGGHEAVAVLPLAIEGAAIGGLAVSFDEVRDFSQEERGFLIAVADLCAQALDRARLYEATRADARRQAFLAQASALLSASLDPRATLAELARLAVPDLADWCSVALAAEGGPETVSVAHADPAKVALAEELQRRYPPDPDAATGAPGVIRTGRSQLVERIDDEMLTAAARDEEHLRLARELGLRSAIVAPLVARARTLGALTLVTAESRRTYGAEDLAFAEDLGRRAGVAIDNALLYEREHDIAQTLQEGLLPARLPEIPDVEVAARYVPAGEGIDVGGDFYDLFEAGGETGWVAVLGDVCGKGPRAATLTGLARHTIRGGADLGSPARVLAHLDRSLATADRGTQFLTAVCAALRPAARGLAGTLARGGHPPALILRADGRVESLRPRGPLIGVLPDALFEEAEVALAPGDALLLYSDGVTEARAPNGAIFGEERLLALLGSLAGASAEGLAARIEDEVGAFQAGRASDDVALLALRVSPGY